MRKWTERKIALWAFSFSILSLILTGIFSSAAHSLNEKTLCLNFVAPKIEEIKNNIYDLPKLVSGCALDPALYCANARAILNKTKNLVLEVKGSLVENPVSTLADILDKTILDLKNTANENYNKLIEDAKDINSERNAINSLNTKELKCSSFLF